MTKREDNTPRVGRYAASDCRVRKPPDRAIGFVGIRPGVVLRSKTPDGVIQEIWALLCACHAVRDLTAAAAALARQDPLRIGFANALDVVRGPVGQPGPFPP